MRFMDAIGMGPIDYSHSEVRATPLLRAYTVFVAVIGVASVLTLLALVLLRRDSVFIVVAFPSPFLAILAWWKWCAVYRQQRNRARASAGIHFLAAAFLVFAVTTNAYEAVSNDEPIAGSFVVAMTIVTLMAVGLTFAASPCINGQKRCSKGSLRATSRVRRLHMQRNRGAEEPG